MAALFVIQFIYGWNQYLWPLLITTDEEMYTVVIGIKRMIVGGDALTEWNLVMATAMLALLPPALVVILDAEVVREGPRGDGKIDDGRNRAQGRQEELHQDAAGDPRRERARSPTASSS